MANKEGGLEGGRACSLSGFCAFVINPKIGYQFTGGFAVELWGPLVSTDGWHRGRIAAARVARGGVPSLPWLLCRAAEW